MELSLHSLLITHLSEQINSCNQVSWHPSGVVLINFSENENKKSFHTSIMDITAIHKLQVAFSAKL